MIRMNKQNEDLRNRKYPVLLIKDGVRKALQASRHELRKVKKKTHDKLLSFV